MTTTIEEFGDVFFSDTMLAKCVGFKRYEIFLDDDKTQLAGFVLKDSFYEGPEFSNMTSEELIELALFIEQNNDLVLH